MNQRSPKGHHEQYDVFVVGPTPRALITSHTAGFHPLTHKSIGFGIRSELHHVDHKTLSVSTVPAVLLLKTVLDKCLDRTEVTEKI